MKHNSSDQPVKFVTNHGRVLVCIAADPTARLRDIADKVGITERTAAQIVGDLEHARFVTKTRVGRRNRYEVRGERTVPTPRLGAVPIGQLLLLLLQVLDQQPFA